NAVLDSQSVSGFQNGKYLVWALKGHVVLRFTLTGGANAVVSGLFFDTPPPQAYAPSPVTGIGRTQPFTFTFSDALGASDIGNVQVQFNSGNGSYPYYWCFAVIGSGGNVYMTDDNGNGMAPFRVGQPGGAWNSRCSIDGPGSSLTLSGNTWTLTLSMSFTSLFSGNRKIYTVADNSSGVMSDAQWWAHAWNQTNPWNV